MLKDFALAMHVTEVIMLESDVRFRFDFVAIEASKKALPIVSIKS